MTDTSAPSVAPATPILVHSTPTPDQIKAGVRQTLLAASTIAATLGFTTISGELGDAVALSGIIGGAIVFVLGQLKTRSSATKLATMANALPNSIAQVKS